MSCDAGVLATSSVESVECGSERLLALLAAIFPVHISFKFFLFLFLVLSLSPITCVPCIRDVYAVRATDDRTNADRHENWRIVLVPFKVGGPRQVLGSGFGECHYRDGAGWHRVRGRVLGR